MSETTCGQCGVTLSNGPGVHGCQIRTYRCDVCNEDHPFAGPACYVKDQRRVDDLERRLDALANRLDMLSAKVERGLERLKSARRDEDHTDSMIRGLVLGAIDRHAGISDRCEERVHAIVSEAQRAVKKTETDDRIPVPRGDAAIRAIWGKPPVEQKHAPAEMMDEAAEMLERARSTLRESGILHGSSILYDLGCVIQVLNELRARRGGM